MVDRYVVQDNATIEQAMRCIDQSGGTVALITYRKRLVGLVPKGDNRLAKLQGSLLSRPVAEVMNSDPFLLRTSEMEDNTRLSEALMFLKETGANVMPVIDDDSRLLDLLFTPQLEALVSRALRKTDGDSKQRPRILLVGGAGYIGSVLARLLIENGFDVRVADRLMYGREPIETLIGQPHYEFFRSDIRHIENMIDLVADVYAVVHMAEIVGDPACALDPSLALETNFLSVLAFATLCSHIQVNRFVYLSSCSVYGANSNPDKLLTEDSPLNPVSLYAQMKVKTESGLVELAERSVNFSPVLLRLATVFGWSLRPRFDLVVNRMTAQAVRDGTITIFGGEQWRPNIHVSDVSRAILAVLQAPVVDISCRALNVGDNDLNYQVREIGESVARGVVGTRIQLEVDNTDKRDYRVSFDAIRELLGFEASVSLSDGIREISEFLDLESVDFHHPRYNNLYSLRMQ